MVFKIALEGDPPVQNGEATFKSDLLDALLWFHHGFFSSSLFSRRIGRASLECFSGLFLLLSDRHT